jgi:nucleotide-binding universal stress UspA family protein
VYKHILVPLDGTRLAEAVLPVAVQLAGKIEARVTLLHIIEEDAPERIHGERHLTSLAGAMTYLEKVKKEFFPGFIDVRTHVHETEARDVAQSIVSHAADLESDLIAMCTHGRGGLAGFLLGSIAEQILDLGRTAVLVLYPHNLEKHVELDHMNFLVPLDGDPEHETGFRTALQLARACNASLHLVMAVHILSTLPGEQAASAIRLPGATNAMLEINQEQGLRYLHGLIRSAGEAATGITLEVRRGDPVRVVLKAARRSGSDIIVMAMHGKSSMDSFWADSLTPKIARRSHIPLLLVPVDED